MEIVFTIILYILFGLLVAGLVKPAWVFSNSDATRGKVLKVYGGSYLILAIIASGLYGNKGEKSAISAKTESEKSDPVRKDFDDSDMTLQEYSDKSAGTRKDIVEEFVDDWEIPEDHLDGLYSCLSQMTYTKSKELTLQTVLGEWCYGDYLRDPKLLAEYVNFDNFEKQFSPWDGAFRPLEKQIKNSMHNEDSYDHIETRYRLILDDNPRAVLVTKFRGSNPYGAIVKQSVNATIDLKTMAILSIE